jgi:hypothetical protein
MASVAKASVSGLPDPTTVCPGTKEYLMSEVHSRQTDPVQSELWMTPV